MLKIIITVLFHRSFATFSFVFSLLFVASLYNDEIFSKLSVKKISFFHVIILIFNLGSRELAVFSCTVISDIIIAKSF